MDETEGLGRLLLLTDEHVDGEDETDNVPLGHCDVEGEPEEEALEDRDAVTHAVPLALDDCNSVPEGLRVLLTLAQAEGEKLADRVLDTLPEVVPVALGLGDVDSVPLLHPEAVTLGVSDKEAPAESVDREEGVRLLQPESEELMEALGLPLKLL